MRRRMFAIPAVLAAAVTLAVAAAPSNALTYTQTTTKLSGADGGTEPRVAIAPDGDAYVVTNAGGTARVYRKAATGTTWSMTSGVPTDQEMPTIDTDVVVTRTGRIIASELDFAGTKGVISFRNSYSDDDGATWHSITGATLSDTDRQWFAVGPDDPTTHLPRVYLLWHNLASGEASHNMWVQTSTDNGATFGPPIPTTLPGSQAWSDLQCADSGGPSGIAVGPTGRIYVFFGTRGSTVAPAGGCGASVSPGPFEVNVVSATRVWAATSADGGLTWTDSLAVDRVSTGQIVGMELSPGAVDTAGNVYVTFPESVSATDFTAAIKYVVAPPDLSSWSAPKTVAAVAGAGNILPHVVAGDPGRLTFAYMAGETGSPDHWYSEIAQTLNGLDAAPTFQHVRLSTSSTYTGTAAQLMAQCGSGALKGIENGFLCGRSADVYGIGLDANGFTYVTWPNADASWGTFVSVQTGGDSLYGP